MPSTTPAEGLCYVTSKPKDPSQLSDVKFNAFYDDEHVPDILRYGFAKVALRYKNSNPDSPAAYLALYPQNDVTNLASPATAQMMEDLRKSKVLDGQDHHELIEYGVSAWTKIQTFEGYGHDSKNGQDRGQTLVAVFMEPGDGAEPDLDAWYRKQHLDMLAMCRGYRRSTRYRRHGDGDRGPSFLALHEYACQPEELPAEQIKQVRETEWSRDIIVKANVFEREVWVLLGARGEVEMKL